MGLFDKIKGIKNAVTGGAADVAVEVGQADTEQPIPVRVTARAKADFKINRVYLLIRAHEEALVRDVDIERDGRVSSETVRGEYETCKLEIEVAGSQELQEGEEYTWECEVNLPGDANPSFSGETIRHLWSVQAGLDARGNDPDSGWVEFWID
ncbi:MAG: hypothetical protein MJE77_05495 [Proteobacteria bacterium]|nr:hypothetical protein [Pseudomonadota bacterium]